MKPLIMACVCLAALSAQDAQRGGSLDSVLLKRMRDPKWGAILDRLESNAKQAEATAQKLQILAAKAKAKRDQLIAEAAKDPSKAAQAEAARITADAAEGEARRAVQEGAEKRRWAEQGHAMVASAINVQLQVDGAEASLASAKSTGDKPLEAALDTLAKQAKARAAMSEAETNRVLAESGSGVRPPKHLIPGLESAGVTIQTYFGTRWSNLYRDPQAHDTFFRPKGFFALEHEQYFWLSAYPQLLSKWGGGAMIQGSKESDFQETETSAGFKKAVNATDTASAHAYVWIGGFISDTTTMGAFLQHQFSNYSFQPSDDPSAPKSLGFTDVIRSQRRLGILIQQHDPAWRGSLLEYSLCQDPLFIDSRNRQFLRGRAMYNFDALKSLGFYLEGSINRGRSRERDRDDATITLGFRLDLRVWAGN